jgi:hypothetical protein
MHCADSVCVSDGTACSGEPVVNDLPTAGIAYIVDDCGSLRCGLKHLFYFYLIPLKTLFQSVMSNDLFIMTHEFDRTQKETVATTEFIGEYKGNQ